jgi:hypothetical protein
MYIRIMDYFLEISIMFLYVIFQKSCNILEKLTALLDYGNYQKKY